jgi:chromosome partitioning protein
LKIIAVVQLKGGTGRSTLATTLAGELSKVGETFLLDADVPQATAASWAALRQQTGRDRDLVIRLAADIAEDHRELISKIEEAKKAADFVVIDGAPRLAEVSRAMLVMADLVLVPVGASAAEIWATQDLKALLQEASKVKRINARLVWTRLRPATRLAKDLTERATKELGLRALNTALSLRVAYIEALGAGLTAAELADQEARQEVEALVAEVRALLRRKS